MRDERGFLYSSGDDDDDNDDVFQLMSMFLWVSNKV